MSGPRRRRGPWMPAIAAVLVLVVVTGVVVGCGGGGGGGGDTDEVGALWYGTTQDGTTVGGVTPVDIKAVDDDPETPLAVDTRDLQASGAGPMWAAATAVAGAQAVLISGIDPRLQQLRYSLHESIDGPSAGALLSVGSLAALRGLRSSDSTTMTGTVLPDGSVGPVTGIGEKLRAAAEAGYTRVLIPAGITEVLDYKTGREVDPVRLGRSLGVKVAAVKSVPEAYSRMAAGPERSSSRPPPPLREGILRMLTRRSRALIAKARGQVSELRGAENAAEEATNIAALVGAAERALADRNPVLAFTASAEAAQAGQQSVAEARVHAAATHETLAQLAAQVGRSVERSRAAVRAQVRATAETPVAKVAQLTALSDTLSWGAFALTSFDVVDQRLKTVHTEAQLAEIVRFLETAKFEAATYMPACAESLSYIGRRPITTRTVGLLDAYSGLIGYAADANRRYADTIGLELGESSYLGQLLDESEELSRALSPTVGELRGPTAEPAMRMAVALLEYVESTQLVNDLTSREGSGINGPPNLAPIKDPLVLRNQARTADAIATKQVRDIWAAGVDPAFVQWNSDWGADLSFGRLPNTTEEQRLHGLEFQWFATLQSRLLAALERA